MKIGYFTDSYLPSPDGVATSVESSAKELQKLGHEVFIIAPNQPHEKDRKHVYRLTSVKIVQSPEIWWALEVPQPALFKIAKLELDIIHGHSGGPVSFLGWQLAHIHNIPFVETYHTLWKYYRHYFLYPELIKLSLLKKLTAFLGNDFDAIITPSVKAKNELRADGVKKPVYIVPNGIYRDTFKDKHKGFLRHKFDIPQNKKILLTVGRLAKEKSIDFLIKSFALVHTSDPDTVFVIVGNGKDKAALQELAASLGLENAVLFAGSVAYNDMPNVYADADVFLFASQTETQGMVVVEAMASSIPVIAVEDNAFIEVVVNGKNGWLVKKDKELFADKIRSVLKDRKLLTYLSKNALETTKSFDISYTTTILVQVYEEIIFLRNNLPPKKQFYIGANRHLPKEFGSLKELLESIKG